MLRSARRKLRSFGIDRNDNSIPARLTEFRRSNKLKGRKLSKAHRQKISQSLKDKNRSGREERILKIRESEARARTLRNVGYIANSAGNTVREARLTARFLGIGPRKSKARGLAKAGRVLGIADLSTGQAARTVRNIRSILR